MGAVIFKESMFSWGHTHTHLFFSTDLLMIVRGGASISRCACPVAGFITAPRQREQEQQWRNHAAAQDAEIETGMDAHRHTQTKREK